jgi:hypothetical protein
MKWLCTVVVSLIVFFGVLFSPWPQFIFGVSNKILEIPEAAYDTVFQDIIKVSAVVTAYILFPTLGCILGYIVGVVLARKFD